MEPLLDSSPAANGFAPTPTPPPAHQLPTPALSPVVELASPDLPSDSDASIDGQALNGQEPVDASPFERTASGLAIDGAFESTEFQALNGSNRRRSSSEKRTQPFSPDKDKILKLSSAQIQKLTSSPHSLPVRTASPIPELPSPEAKDVSSKEAEKVAHELASKTPLPNDEPRQISSVTEMKPRPRASRLATDIRTPLEPSKSPRPAIGSRATSTPVMRRKPSSTRPQSNSQEVKPTKPVPPPLNLEKSTASNLKVVPPEVVGSPMPTTIPLPPLSMATYLQLELSAERPSPLYIYRPAHADFPYESAKIKYERLLNFLYLPPQLERTLVFGFFTCLDAFLYTFTILPLRFGKAVWMLFCWLLRTTWKEAKDLAHFVYWGLGRLWERRSATSISGTATPVGDGSTSRRPSATTTPVLTSPRTTPLLTEQPRKDVFSQENTRRILRGSGSSYRHRRTKSRPSALTASHKADLLKGLLVISSCFVLMRFDASRMYHNIRGQAAIKLYVIYNVLEVSQYLLIPVLSHSTNKSPRFLIAFLLHWVRMFWSVYSPKRHLNAILTAEAK